MKKILLSLIISITTYLGATATANADTTVPVDLAACCRKISDDSVFKHCMQQALTSDIQNTETQNKIKNCASKYLSKDLHCLATYAKHQNNNARIMYKTDNKTYKFDMKIEDLLKLITFDNQIALWLYTTKYRNYYHPSDTIPRTNLTEDWWSGDYTDLKKLTLESLKKINQYYPEFGFGFVRDVYFPGLLLQKSTKLISIHKSEPLIMNDFYTALQHYNALQDGLQNSDCCKGYDLYIVTGDKKFTNLTKDRPTKITILYGPY